MRSGKCSKLATNTNFQYISLVWNTNYNTKRHFNLKMTLRSKLFLSVGIGVVLELAYIALKMRKEYIAKNINEFFVLSDSCCCNSSQKESCSDITCRLHNIKRMLHVLQSSCVSIDLCMFTLGSSELLNLVINAYHRGVNVRVIFDINSCGSQKNSVFYKLYKEGIPIRYKNSTSHMHHKFCIVDGSKRVTELYKAKESHDRKPFYTNGLVITGSMNWISQVEHGNYEAILLTTEESLVSQYEDIFSSLWEDFVTQ